MMIGRLNEESIKRRVKADNTFVISANITKCLQNQSQNPLAHGNQLAV
jgi:hypothetical protein